MEGTVSTADVASQVMKILMIITVPVLTVISIVSAQAALHHVVNNHGVADLKVKDAVVLAVL